MPAGLWVTVTQFHYVARSFAHRVVVSGPALGHFFVFATLSPEEVTKRWPASPFRTDEGVPEASSPPRCLVTAFHTSCSVLRLRALNKFQTPHGRGSCWMVTSGFTWFRPQGDGVKADMTYCSGNGFQREKTFQMPTNRRFLPKKRTSEERLCFWQSWSWFHLLGRHFSFPALSYWGRLTQRFWFFACDTFK